MSTDHDHDQQPFTVDEMGWHWKLNDGCLDLCDRDDRRLACIKERPHYCDRGHFQVVIDIGLNLEPIDGRELMYYMDLEVAMWETVEFLYWRICKVSYHARGFGSIEAWAKDNCGPSGMDITSLEYKSTAWYTTPSACNEAVDRRVLKRKRRPLPYVRLRVPEDRQEIENRVAGAYGVPRHMVRDQEEPPHEKSFLDRSLSEKCEQLLEKAKIHRDHLLGRLRGEVFVGLTMTQFAYTFKAVDGKLLVISQLEVSLLDIQTEVDAAVDKMLKDAESTQGVEQLKEEVLYPGHGDFANRAGDQFGADAESEDVEPSDEDLENA